VIVGSNCSTVPCRLMRQTHLSCSWIVQIDSADTFEKLTLHSNTNEPVATYNPSLRLSCGAGALTMPRFAPQRIALRVHATSSLTDAQTFPWDAPSPSNKIPFEYQVIIENEGCVPVQVLGRFFTIHGGSRPWDVDQCGTRKKPRDGVLGRKPVILPGGAMTYKSCAQILAQGGTMRGGYLVRPPPSSTLFCSCPRIAHVLRHTCRCHCWSIPYQRSDICIPSSTHKRGPVLPPVCGFWVFGLASLGVAQPFFVPCMCDYA
jgi:uncharacterized protein affecting Mg2+/Co2+ transport